MSGSTARERKRGALIEAAAVVFAAQGFANTRIADIAVQAGVGKGTVYEYFASKEDLFFAVFEKTNARIGRRIEARLAEASGPEEELTAVLTEGASVVAELRETYSLNLDFWAACRGGDGEGRFKGAIDELYDGYRGLVAGILRRGQATGRFRSDLDAEALAAIIVGAVDGLGVQHWIDPSIDPHRASGGLIAALSRGLVQEPS